MKVLKKMIRKHDKPLQQIIKRFDEIFINDKIKFKDHDDNNTFTVKKPDCFILTSGGEIVQITEILSNNSLVIVGRSFDSKVNV